MERCECSNAGFCKFYEQEMTYDPPNWQWCQNATPEKRVWFLEQCKKKRVRKEKEAKYFLAVEYITTEKLIKDCRDLLLPQVAKLNLKGVLGIPRSGMLPASMIAMWLNLPMYAFDTSDRLFALSGATEFGGVRMKDHEDTSGRLLVVDDTVYAGTAMEDMKTRISEHAFFSCVYLRPESKFKPDFYARELKPPHLLEWNLFNCTYIEHALLDFDGIFCPNVPQEACKNESKYIEYIKNVEPFYHRIPKTKCKGIVTARLEKYRSITEDWLKRHNINYGFLKMYPTEEKETRDKNHIEEVSTFKADEFSRSDASFFVESELAEAIRIKEKSGKFVICPK